MIDFNKLTIFNKYNRDYLADFFGYKNRFAILRGVVTPSKQPVIILFVTFIKQKSEIQYNDWIDGEFLHWEGENMHISDKRIINAKKNNEKIFLFYRNKHHTDFTFYGEVILWGCLEETKKPSNFIYKIPALSENQTIKNNNKSEIVNKIDPNIKNKAAKGQFKQQVFMDWEGKCAVTSLSDPNLLSFAYIKPWGQCSHKERYDSCNGLLLLPSLKHLLNRGFISFDDNGKILISDQLSQINQDILNINTDMCLYKIDSKLKNYLNFHRKNVFN